MANTTTTTILPAPVQQSFSLKLLAVPTPNFIHKIAALKKRMPRNGGTTIRFRRYNPLPTSLVPLGNTGITPPPVELTAQDIDAKMDFYGQYIRINEQVTLQNQDPVLNEASERLGVALRQTEDELTRNMLASTMSIIDCANGAGADQPTTISRADINRVTRALLNADAYTIFDNIEATTGINTVPVRDAYFAMCNSALSRDLNSVDNFISKWNYPSTSGALPSEWGSVDNVRFLLSSIGSVSPNASNLGNDVYNIFITGREAYACVEQDGYSAQFIYRPPIYDGPLALNASVGYKFAQVPRILNDKWIINLRATISA